MTIDTRILERRQEVAEDRAKRSLGRLLRLLAVLVPAAVIGWLAFSPWLSVSAVEVEGAVSSATYEILAQHRVVPGTPMILLNASGVEAALKADPWVSEATVNLHWPDGVSVDVVEHQPLAWVQTEGGWTRRALDGSVVPSAETPDPSLPVVILPETREGAVSPELLGALEWVDALPARFREGLVVRIHEEELWAEVAGHRVRLGRPVEMTAKAMSLTSLLARALPAGAEINLLAPTHPAVAPPSTPDDEATEDKP